MRNILHSVLFVFMTQFNGKGMTIHNQTISNIERKRLLMIIVILCLLRGAYAQNLYTYNNLYSIRLPQIVELQHSELNNIKQINGQGNSSHTKISTLSTRIVFQQKGLNADIKSAYSKYCRVIIEYYNEGREAPVYGRGDNIDIDRDLLYGLYDSIKDGCNADKTPLIKFLGIQTLTINGFPVIYYSYKRKGREGKDPPVIVNIYQIFNRYESVALALSYREAERETWKGIHEYIMKSFSFKNKY